MNTAVMNLACFTAFQLISWQAYLADCSSHDWRLRCISHTSTPANVGLSYGKACLAASPALQNFYRLPSFSSHYTGQGSGRRRVRYHCSVLGGRTDVGPCILALEEIWTQPKEKKDWVGGSSPSLSANDPCVIPHYSICMIRLADAPKSY